MQYLKKELWMKINDPNEDVRIQAEREWNENCLIYQQQWEKIQEHLSRSFVKSFMIRKGLHDYVVLDVNFTKKRREYSCKLKLTNGLENLSVTMHGLKELQIDVVLLHNCIQGSLTWGYCEFEIMPDNYIKLAVLCDTKNEMAFQFKSITISQE